MENQQQAIQIQAQELIDAQKEAMSDLQSQNIILKIQVRKLQAELDGLKKGDDK